MIKRITVDVHEKTHHQARVWAAEHGTSISAVVAYLLETLPGLPRAARASPPARNVSAPKPHSPSSQPETANQAASSTEKTRL